MKSKMPVAPSVKFARYAAASAAALGATAAAEAQSGNFQNTYTLAPVSGNNYGVWTLSVGQVGNGSVLVDDTNAITGNQISLTSNAPTGSIAPEILNFTTVAQATGTVNFFVNVSTSGMGVNSTFYYTADNNYFFSRTGASYVSFGVTSGATFGFRLVANYAGAANGISAGIYSFSAPAAAVPEPGATGLLAGCAAAGFIALVGVRKARERAGRAA